MDAIKKALADKMFADAKGELFVMPDLPIEDIEVHRISDLVLVLRVKTTKLPVRYFNIRLSEML